MSMNWNAFLDESLNLPLDQWSDPTTIIGHSTDMPPLSSASRAAGTATSTGLNNFDFAINANNDQYVTDAYFNPEDYFISDLDNILPPFGEALPGDASPTESSPEPTSGLSYGTGYEHSQIEMPSSNSQTPASSASGSNQSPVLPSVQVPVTLPREPQRAQTYPNPTYESMFPNNLDTGFVEDLTFPNGPNGPPRTSKSTVDNNNTLPEPIDLTTTVTKRNRAEGKADILSACWTSPLCPNHDQDGPPPNPSSCGGGCAPFLFADDAPSATKKSSSASDDLDDIQEEGVVEIKSRPARKRTESDASNSSPSGRQFTATNASESQKQQQQQQPSLKTESESPVDPPATTTDDKPKAGGLTTRRRLPHNQVERKYRESLNTQLDSLRRVVPALQNPQRPPCDNNADIEDLPTPSKPSKAVILASATAYIKQMEKERQGLLDEVQSLRGRVKALQALVQCDGCSLMQYFVDLKVQPPGR